MRTSTILFLIMSNGSLAQTFDASIQNLESITPQEKRLIKSLFTDDNVSVYLTSDYTDSLLLKMINDYRQQHTAPLKRLELSIRLDTLSELVARAIGNSGEFAHYPAFPELSPIADLLNIENLAYNASSKGFNETSFETDEPSTDIVVLRKFIDVWIKSPGHNRNMLANVEVGAATVMLRITKRNSSFFIETIVVFEADHTYSKRELDEKFKRKNEELLKRPIRIAAPKHK